MRRPSLASLVLATFVALSACNAPWLREDTPLVRLGSDLDAEDGAVVCVDPLAAEVGARVLARGGNAVDAAVATALALSVTWPEAGNLGGGGFLLLRARGGDALCIDAREVAPRAATPDMFLDESGEIDPVRSRLGWLAAGVPGSVAGMALAHERAGSLPWSDLVAPAIALAEEGFAIAEPLARSIAESAGELALDPEASRIFLHEDGRPRAAGERLVQQDLAASLRALADEGPNAFYRGAIARLLAADSAARGGMLTQDDLAGYRAVERAPLVFPYRGHTVVAAPPPTAGGFVLASALAQLEAFRLDGEAAGSAAELHLLAEALRRAFLDRALHLGDPEFTDVPLERLLSPERIDQHLDSFDPARATPSDRLALDLDGTLPPQGEHTTHLSVVDRHGNAVAFTTTLEESFGAKTVAKGTGIVLNNQMHDFNLDPGRSDRDGRVGTPPNQIAPGKRMLSSMCPVFVVAPDQKLLLVAGSPGGRTIPATVLRLVTGAIDHRLPPRDLVDLPRIHHGLYPDRLRIEARAPADVKADLESRGHTLQIVPAQGDAHVIARHPLTGRLVGTADRRRDGAVGVPGTVTPSSMR